MAKVRALTEEMHPAFEHLLRDAWMQNWDDKLGREIIRWRFYERPHGQPWVACNDDSCVGMIDSMLRPHMLDGHRVWIRQSADWFCLPNHRTGIGLMLLNRVVTQGEPVLVIGGTGFTQQGLPKFGFRKLGSARYYVRPVTLRGLAGNLLRRRWWQQERLAQMMPHISWRMVERHRPMNGQVSLMDENYEIPPPTGDGLVEIIEPWHWQWLLKMPRPMATPVGLAFSINDKFVGCSISQLEQTAVDPDGRILHLQFVNPDVGRWIINSTVNFLRECNVGFVRCAATTEIKFKLFEEAGFIYTQPMPIHWYSRHVPPPIQVDAGYLHADDAMPLQALRGRRLGERYAHA